ncbi:hypothetical protein BCR44DRAFT_1429433 [Catenaria anguillulae PL171]|uniref:Uncharacterized protein n=1 Tax=Catenaria anguillulae PL171 TaxID=765915 RepID=A0A1Y2HVR1_9FUNG|nr:hypothetical protein BCR44DRAFT_1429433 [Catenaria anguillulae PL171]
MSGSTSENELRQRLQADAGAPILVPESISSLMTQDQQYPTPHPLTIRKGSMPSSNMPAPGPVSSNVSRGGFQQSSLVPSLPNWTPFPSVINNVVAAPRVKPQHHQLLPTPSSPAPGAPLVGQRPRRPQPTLAYTLQLAEFPASISLPPVAPLPSRREYYEPVGR